MTATLLKMASTALTNHSSDFIIGLTFSPDGPVFNYGNMSGKGDFDINGGIGWNILPGLV
jgi:hypothetical protein